MVAAASTPTRRCSGRGDGRGGRVPHVWHHRTRRFQTNRFHDRQPSGKTRHDKAKHRHRRLFGYHAFTTAEHFAAPTVARHATDRPSRFSHPRVNVHRVSTTVPPVAMLTGTPFEAGTLLPWHDARPVSEDYILGSRRRGNLRECCRHKSVDLPLNVVADFSPQANDIAFGEIMAFHIVAVHEQNHARPGDRGGRGMRYSASERAEIIRLVEQSHLPAKRTLDKLGIPRATFYRWCDRYGEGGIEALADHRSRPDRVWNRIPDDVRGQIIDLALERPERSPRELAVRFTDEMKYLSRKLRSTGC